MTNLSVAPPPRRPMSIATFVNKKTHFGGETKARPCAARLGTLARLGSARLGTTLARHDSRRGPTQPRPKRDKLSAVPKPQTVVNCKVAQYRQENREDPNSFKSCWAQASTAKSCCQ
jgi:hypothetical protein